MKDKGRRQVEKQNRVLERLKVEYVTPDKVRPNEYNPNRQNEEDFELLLMSMRDDGFTQPIICQQDGTIVDGEHRWRAAVELGYEKLPVVYVNMTPEQMRISTLRHNRARGTEDIDLTAALLRDLRELGALDWAAKGLNLRDDEIQRIIDDIPAPVALAGEDFNEAWRPGGDQEMSADHKQVSRSAAATHEISQAEHKAEQATTEAERTRTLSEARVYRIVAIFRGDEAQVVRAALGESPADTLLEMCAAEA